MIDSTEIKKDHKRLLWTVIHEQMRKSRRNREMPANSELWRNTNLNRPIISKEIESVIRNFLRKPKTKGFISEFYQIVKK
jgi:hypothetical protein